jgi:hypothetical protein
LLDNGVELIHDCGFVLKFLHVPGKTFLVGNDLFLLGKVERGLVLDQERSTAGDAHVKSHAPVLLLVEVIDQNFTHEGEGADNADEEEDAEQAQAGA